MKLLKNKLQIFITVIFLCFVAWWASFQNVVEAQGKSVQWFVGIYGLVALFGAVVGFIASKKWGGHRTIVGKALMFFSLGLLAQEAGQMTLNYYIYVSKITIPYPSLGDIAYFGSALAYLCGGIYLAKAVGIKYSLKSNKYRMVAVIVPLAILIASFAVFLNHHEYDWHNPITVFLDAGYPIVDAMYISMGIIAFLLSRKMLGGIMRTGLLILMMALIAQYLADWSFLYQSSRETYLAGKAVDLLYLLSYFITTSAIITFYVVYDNLKSKTSEQLKVSNVRTEGAK